MQFAFPTPAKVREALKELRKNRADPNPSLDQAAFDRAWAGKEGHYPESRQFQNGQEPHQLAIAQYLRFQYDARSKTLEAITKEREGYLTTFVLLVAAIGLVAQDQVQQLFNSPYALVIWVPGVIMVMLLRSHSSKLSSLGNNYQGAGRRAGRYTTTYLLVNEMRKALLRRNAEMQRAKRNLAVVCLVYQLWIIGVCIYVTAVRLFG